MNNTNALLSNLLSEFINVPKELDRVILGLDLDSRNIKPGFLFCAYPGHVDDGRKYINIAIDNGAIAILSEGDIPKCEIIKSENNPNSSIPIFYVPNVSRIVGSLAAKLYNYPARQMTVIGVTGTNGKTSITHLISEALKFQNRICGIIGTLGIGLFGNLTPTNTTTPDPITIQRQFDSFLKQDAEAVAMEASSHRLSQGVLESIDFKIAIFTNLTRDHLDYHQNMDDYANAKRKLFLCPSLDYAIINADDHYGIELLRDLNPKIKPFAYSTSDFALGIPTTYAKNIKHTTSGFEAYVETPWGEGHLKSKLLGQFNVSNLLAVLTTLCIMNTKFDKALKLLSELTTVPGRMQVLGGDCKKPMVVVDYAHTPDALEKTLLALRQHCHGELWCIFGCGGGRDRGKRSIMGQIAERYSDQIIITDDNPRNEDPKRITDDILQGLICPWAAKIEHDRKIAIYHAIDCAKVGDVILVAGKGHENYQLIGKDRVPFSDAKTVVEALDRV